jgi:hypothetical protein
LLGNLQGATTPILFSSSFESRLFDNLFEDAGSIHSATNLVSDAWPAGQSRLWNAGGPAGLAALEARDAAARQAQLHQRPQRLGPQDPAPLRAGPGSGGTTPRSGQPDNEIIFLREDDEDDANELSPTIQFISPKGDTNEA